MATPQEKLADALEALHAFQEQGRTIIRTQDLTRVQRERLTRQGFIRPVINGWYIPARADETVGETTAWYASYWDFVSAYLEDRFGDAWSLSPEQSLLLHAEQWSVPEQLLVRSPRGRGQVTQLIHGSSVYDLRLLGAQDLDQTVLGRLRVYKVEAALIAAGPGVYATYPTEMRTILAGQRDFSAVLERLLNGAIPSSRAGWRARAEILAVTEKPTIFSKPCAPPAMMSGRPIPLPDDCRGSSTAVTSRQLPSEFADVANLAGRHSREVSGAL